MLGEGMICPPPPILGEQEPLKFPTIGGFRGPGEVVVFESSFLNSETLDSTLGYLALIKLSTPLQAKHLLRMNA